MLRRLAGKLVLGAVALMILSLAADPAEAKLITFRYSGVVTSVTDYNGVFGGLVSVGDSFAATYTFDSETPDSAADPWYGSYRSSTTAMQTTIGSLCLGAEGISNQIGIIDHAVGDYITFGTYSFTSSGIQIGELTFSLGDLTGTVLSSDALPLVVPRLSVFDECKLFLSGAQIPGIGSASLQGEILALTPEPCTAMLLAYGLGLGVFGRGSKHR